MQRKLYNALYEQVNKEYLIKKEGDIVTIDISNIYIYDLRTDIIEFLMNEMEDDYIDNNMLTKDEYESLYDTIIRWISKERCHPFNWEDYREVAWWFKRELKEEN